jgi:hypothetical protein
VWKKKDRQKQKKGERGKSEGKLKERKRQWMADRGVEKDVPACRPPRGQTQRIQAGLS